jgi:hypothetical protein
MAELFFFPGEALFTRRAVASEKAITVSNILMPAYHQEIQTFIKSYRAPIIDIA